MIARRQQRGSWRADEESLRYRAQAAANPFQYAGGYKDAVNGYTKFGARYYDPATGRFTQPDPSWQENFLVMSGLSFSDGDWSLGLLFLVLALVLVGAELAESRSRKRTKQDPSSGPAADT